MPRRRVGRSSAQSGALRRFTASRVIEASWLGALILVPLVFDGKETLAFPEQPKQFVLHLAGIVIVIAWAVELSFSGERARSLSGLEVRTWAGKSPARWAIVSAGAFALTAILATAFSRLPRVSLWGQDFSDLGYELYSLLILLVFFFAIALRLRGKAQMVRIVYAFAGVGAVSAAYGTAQHFGWDPFGPGANASRVWSTFLNPVFFGSFLVMSVFMTVAATLLTRPGEIRWTALFMVMIGLQIAALWFAGSRGPIFGAFAGGVVLLVLAVIRLDHAILKRAVVPMIGAGGIACVLILIPAGETRGTGSLVGAFSDETPNLDLLSGRVGIWSAAAELVKSREVYPPESGTSSTLRHVFGFGPDMYSYSYPLTVKPDGLRGVDHAHNYPLQVLLELGAAGLVTLVVLVGLVLITLLRLLWPGSNPRPDTWVLVVAVALLAALVGRAVEQGPGVAQLSDLLGYWILMGLAVALSETVRAGKTDTDQWRSSIGTGGTTLSGPHVVSLTTAVVVIAIAGGVFLFKDFQQLRGSFAAVEANDLVAENQGSDALDRFGDAIKLAPDVKEYPIRLHEMLFTAASNETDAQNRRELLEIGYENLKTAAERDPHDFLLRERLALAALGLFEDGQVERRDEVIDRYLGVAESQPHYPEKQALLGNAAVIAGVFDLALAAADRAIELEPNPRASDRAWWVKGLALKELGDPAAAIASFEKAIVAGGENEWAVRAHSDLADVLDELGRSEEAARHREILAELQGR